jgi:hypothetical protein
MWGVYTMGRRLKLHELFKTILGTDFVYFNPPASKTMSYPCIRYSLGAPSQKRANDKIYNSIDKYEVTVIDLSPESSIPDAIQQQFPMCSVDRTYKADNLNHTVLTLYY